MSRLNDTRRLKYEKISDGISFPQKYDFLWMADFMFNDNYATPMWVGWNAKYIPQNRITQRTQYPHPPPKKNQPVSNINISSGRDNEEIVRIASEGQKEKISVTYDLAIAKVAMQIQAEEKPTFDKIFISLGSFHLEMDFFVSWEKLLKNQVVLIFWINVKFWQKGQLIRF